MVTHTAGELVWVIAQLVIADLNVGVAVMASEKVAVTTTVSLACNKLSASLSSILNKVGAVLSMIRVRLSVPV